jgi:hypothetical protein
MKLPELGAPPNLGNPAGAELLALSVGLKPPKAAGFAASFELEDGVGLKPPEAAGAEEAFAVGLADGKRLVALPFAGAGAAAFAKRLEVLDAAGEAAGAAEMLPNKFVVDGAAGVADAPNRPPFEVL